MPLPKPQILTALAFLFLAGLSSTFLSAKTYKTNISVQSSAAPKIKHDAPCYIVYPEGKNLKAIVDAGLKDKVETALQKKGYQIVTDQNNAAIFIKVAFAQLEPFQSNVTIKKTDTFDHSNSAAGQNRAATMMGGRYSEVEEAKKSPSPESNHAILGPNGEIIDLSKQQPDGPTRVEGESSAATITIYPIVFEISAWAFNEKNENLPPEKIWKVTASLENIWNEELAPQLADIGDAAIKQIGKSLKSPKIVSRETTPSF